MNGPNRLAPRRAPKSVAGSLGLALMLAVAFTVPATAQTDTAADPSAVPAFGERSLHILHVPLLDFAPAARGVVVPWRIEWGLESIYANTFSTSQLVNRFHDTPQRRGRPIDPQEVDELHREFPNEPIFFVDGEVVRTALAARIGLPRSLSLSIEVPYIYRDLTLDGAVRSFHHHIGQAQNGRDLFPNGELAAVIQSPGGPVSFFGGPRRSGIGDATAAIFWRRESLGHALTYGFDLALKTPTGSPEKLNGSGGWDGGFRLFVAWCRGPWTAEADASYVVPGAWKIPLRLNPDPFGRIFVSAVRALGRSTRLGASVTAAQSPFRDERIGSLSRNGIEFALGIERDISRLPVRLTLTEHLPRFGDRADFSVGIALRLRSLSLRASGSENGRVPSS